MTLVYVHLHVYYYYCYYYYCYYYYCYYYYCYCCIRSPSILMVKPPHNTTCPLSLTSPLTKYVNRLIKLHSFIVSLSIVTPFLSHWFSSPDVTSMDPSFHLYSCCSSRRCWAAPGSYNAHTGADRSSSTETA